MFPRGLCLHALFSALDAPGLQPGDEELLAADEHDEHRYQAGNAHGEYVAPLGELVLPKETGDGDGQRALEVVVDDGHRPGPPRR